MDKLRACVINLKSLNQDIDDFIIIGAGDANGRTLSVILTQEAAARFTPQTRLYLSWKHDITKIEGLDVFKKVSNQPAIWEIKFPQEMLAEGQVLACLKIIDEISIDCSTNFLIHILSDPNHDKVLEDSPNYTLFKTAALDLNNLHQQGEEQLIKQEEKFKKVLAWVSEIEERLKEIVDNRIGELPEDVSNFMEYVEKVQKEQDAEIDKKLQKTQEEVEETAKQYTDEQVLQLQVF